MIISRTPLRISIVGGGTDLPGYYRSHGPGGVVSTAINRYIYTTCNRKFDDLIRVSYSKTEIVDSVDGIEHNLAREALRMVGIEGGVEIVFMADLPLRSVGSGLGSSSAMAVGVLHALHAYKGEHVSAERLAREACEIEMDILGHPIGKQDQYITAYGGMNYIQFNPDDTVYVDPIICPAASKKRLAKKLMLFYTGLDRVSSNILEEQNNSIPDKVAFHDKMVGLSTTLRERLCENDIEAAGPMLHQNWLYKKQLASTISNGDIDRWYQMALDAGATGGKISGAGGGGFLLLYCDEDKQDAVRDTLSELTYGALEFEPQGSKIIYVSD